MELPVFLVGRPVLEAENMLHATSLSVLVPFYESGLITATELEFGFEDLPLLADAAGLVRDAARRWHVRAGVATDFRVLQRGFVHAFRAGLDVAAQIHRHDGEGLAVNGSLDGIFEGKARLGVGVPLTEWAEAATTTAEDVFVTFQNQSLAIAASSKNQELLDDFYACGCLWSALAGVEAGLTRLDAPAAA